MKLSETLINLTAIGVELLDELNCSIRGGPRFVQSQIYMDLFYPLTSCVRGEVPLIDLPFVMIIFRNFHIAGP